MTVPSLTAPSLRRNLVLTLLILMLLSWVVAVLITVVLAQQLVVRQVERQLIQYMDMAHHTQGVIFRSDPLKDHFWRSSKLLSREAGITRIQGFGTQGREQAMNIWFDTQQILVGELAPAFPEPLEPGFITWRQQTEQGRNFWRVLYRHDPELGIWMAVGVDLQHAGSLGRAALLRAMFPLLIVLPLTVLVLLWGVKRGLSPLQRLAKKIEARTPHALEPIETADVPLEIRPVVEALNGLLGRLERALASESRFTANAAHELQTPLAAIKAEVQRYERQVSGGEEREMLERISTRVSRATNTVTQLLTLARLDPEQEFQREPVNLNELLFDSLAEEGDTALERQLDLQIAEGPDLVLLAQRDWLKIMLRNLVINAFRHAPVQSTVELAVARQPDCVRLTIANDCAPLDSTERQRLMDRFYTPTSNASSGVGLGLSIASRIAELHGATLSLDEWRDGQGFLVTVDFPRAMLAE